MIKQFLILFSAFSSFINTSPIEELINAREFIAIVEIGETKTPNLIRLDIVQTYKGLTEYYVCFNGVSQEEIGSKFIVLGDYINEGGNRLNSNTVMLIPIESIKQDVFDALNELPCYDVNETIEERIKKSKESGDKYTLTGACPRNYSPVCGCNGKTYGNLCEMHNDGIMRYKIGECE